MPSSTEIRVPRETVNDDFVTIAEWHVAAGAPVRSMDVVVSIETSKAVLEVEAGADGHVEILHAAGSEVPVGELIGHVHEKPVAASADGLARKTTIAPAAVGAGGDGPVGATISRKAQRLIDEHGIDANAFAGKGLVREAEVIAYLEARQEAAAAPAAGAERPGPGHDLAPAARETRLSDLGDLKVAAGERGRSIVFVAVNYFFRTWLLGNLVRWAPRGVILPLHRLRGVKMGTGCFIDPSAIVETAYAENVTLGDDVRITAGAIIMTHIKAPHYLRATGIMPAVVKPVVLEDHCFIGVNAVVLPGVTVGRASVVASGSVVVSNVPPYTMVSGNPAKVIKRFPKPAGAPGEGSGRGQE